MSLDMSFDGVEIYDADGNLIGKVYCEGIDYEDDRYGRRVFSIKGDIKEVTGGNTQEVIRIYLE